MPNKDLDRFERDLIQATARLTGFLAKAATESALILESELKEYPPQPARDRAKSFNTYVRGVGHFPKSYFTGGGRSGGQPRYTSEKLGASWAHKVTVRPGLATAALTNPTSYLDYVEGDEQTAYHAQTGWPTVDGVIKDNEGEIWKEVEKALDGFFRSF